MSDSLNTASGRITIDTSQLEAARAAVNQFATGINTTLTGINAGAGQAQSGLTALTGALRGVSAAFGISFGAQGIKQLADAAINAAATATAYGRQEVAARNLAGSQGRLNSLLEVYNSATGGAIDQATALQNVTKLMAVGFADNAGELEKFATAIRGISVAMGTSQDYVTQNLILELFSQRGQRLDQLGLQYSTVKQRADELQAADSTLTAKQAYQNAVLEQASQRYGSLARSAEGAATGMEKAGKAATNANLAIGQVLAPSINLAGNAMAAYLQSQTDLLHGYERAWVDLYRAMQRALGINVPTGMTERFISSSSGRDLGRHSGGAGSSVNPNQTEIDASKLDWGKGIQQLNADTNAQLLEQNQSYQDQRTSSEQQYQQTTSRAAQDFALSRQREEQDMVDSIARIHRDAATREAQAAADLARSISQAEADSNDHIAKTKADSAKQIADLDSNYEKQRIQRAKDLSNQLLDAAGNLDAKQVYELQRNAARQEDEAKQAHDDQRTNLQKQLQERLDDESKSLAKSIAQQQDAYNRQIQAGRDADTQRITDMQIDAQKRQDQENTDYAIRMARARQDHDDQLTEMGRQQGLRIQQIKDHAAADRTQLDDEHQRALTALGVHNQQWLDAETKADNDALKELSRVLNAGRGLLLFPNASGLSSPLVTPGASNAYGVSGAYGTGGNSYNNSSHSFSPTVNVNIQGGSALTQKQVDDAVHDALMRVYSETQ